MLMLFIGLLFGAALPDSQVDGIVALSATIRRPIQLPMLILRTKPINP